MVSACRLGAALCGSLSFSPVSAARELESRRRVLLLLLLLSHRVTDSLLGAGRLLLGLEAALRFFPVPSLPDSSRL